MTHTPLHLRTDMALTRRRKVFGTALAVLPALLSITVDEVQPKLRQMVAEAEDIIIGDTLGRDETDTQRHYALIGGWSHDYVAWHVDIEIWAKVYKESGLDVDGPSEAFCNLFSEPVQSAYPFDTWLPLVTAELAAQPDENMPSPPADLKCEEEVSQPRIEDIAPEYVEEDPINALESQKSAILRASKWMTTVDIIPEGGLKYEWLAGCLLKTLLRGKCWTLLEGAIANGQLDLWFCLGALESARLTRRLRFREAARAV
ncbi:hypothetical protein PG994_005497 [Apiospora phragmitis]|uniref:Uncharacterized protein n=1 Tax=Apiospora phragmitis TaxID=2905665 RepID=A0ABR1VCD9_9PEZI